jgi:hypothetical protein
MSDWKVAIGADAEDIVTNQVVSLSESGKAGAAVDCAKNRAVCAKQVYDAAIEAPFTDWQLDFGCRRRDVDQRPRRVRRRPGA